MADLFRNSNDFPLGKKQNGDIVHDVKLPPWAKSPEEFVSINLAALESEYTSAHLHEWVDLIFGFKQDGVAAIEATNVFHHFTYEGSVDLDRLASTNPSLFTNCVSMIENFGQCPPQLLVKPHPKRSSITTNVPVPMFSRLNLDNTKYYPRIGVDLSIETSPSELIPFPPVNLSKSEIFFIAVLPNVEFLITVDTNRTIGIHRFRSEVPTKMPPFSLEIDNSIFDATTATKQVGLPYAHPTEAAASTFSASGYRQLLAVSRDEKYLFSCGHWDHTFKVSSLNNVDFIELQSIEQNDIVTCISVCSDGDLLITGCLDRSVMRISIYSKICFS